MHGMAFTVDENYTATLTSTSGAVKNATVYVGYVFAPALATGT